MSDPAAALPATLVATIAALSVIPGINAAVVLGAFAGSVVFVLGADDIGTAKKLAYLVVAFIGGLLGAKFFTTIMTALVFNQIAIDQGVGALVAGTLIVKTLRWLLNQDIGKIVGLLRGTRP